MEPRAVSEEQGNKMAEELNVSYFETSALTGQGINEAFNELTRDIMKRKGVDNVGNDSLDLKNDISKKKKDGNGCC